MIYPSLWSEKVERKVRDAGKDLDPQERPTAVRFCKACVISNQRPRIVFDDMGVCSACRFAGKKRTRIDWPERAKSLGILLDNHRLRHNHDVIVPCSGGKDSGAVAYHLREADMNPLGATWAPFMPTEIGIANLQSFVHAGFTVVGAQPDGLLHRRLARLAFEFLGDPFQPFVYGQMAWPLHVALRFGIPLVMYGENGEAEYGGDPAANDKPCWDLADWERVYSKGVGVKDLILLGLELGAFTDDDALRLTTLYLVPPRKALKAAGIECHWLSYYRFWHPQENYYTAAENLGFEANPERSEGTYSKYASLDDKLDGLHYYMAHLKFGLGRASSDAAHEIRDGDLTREEALGLVRKYDGEFPGTHFAECCDYLSLDERQFLKICDRFRPPHLWDRWERTHASGWTLKHAVWK